jgi:hypothetical protein
MTTPKSTGSSRSGQSEENRYFLVNTVAQSAKVILSHDNTTTLSNHTAIREALQQHKKKRTE